jgi:hypothetical protein
MMGRAGRFNKAKKDDGSQYLATGIGLGITLGTGIGTAIGAAIQNIGVGIAVGVGCGMALGVGIGSLMARKTKRASVKTRTPLPGPNS